MLAIANALDGLDRNAAARLAGMSGQALCDAIKRYNAEGIDGLHDRAKPGRPRRLDAIQEKELGAIVIAGPDVEQEGVSAYTRENFARIVREKWQVSYHPGSIGRVLRRLGFSRQKARPSHPKKDEAAQEAFKKGRATPQGYCRYTWRQARARVLPGRSPHRPEGTRLSSLVHAR
jgi:putative transposase